MWSNGKKIQVDANTIGQYTGIDDIKGNKIFEGDILDFLLYNDFEEGHKFRGFVKYEEGSFNIKESICYMELGIAIRCREKLVVVDNIYDNPDLVEKHFKDEERSYITFGEGNIPW